MKWMEIIEVRTPGGENKTLELKLEGLARKAGANRNSPAIKSYLRGMISTDYCVHLYHDSQTVEEGGSVPGLTIASALKPYGLVNHSIWIERT